MSFKMTIQKSSKQTNYPDYFRSEAFINWMPVDTTYFDCHIIS